MFTGTILFYSPETTNLEEERYIYTVHLIFNGTSAFCTHILWQVDFTFTNSSSYLVVMLCVFIACHIGNFFPYFFQLSFSFILKYWCTIYSMSDLTHVPCTNSFHVWLIFLLRFVYKVYSDKEASLIFITGQTYGHIVYCFHIL